MTTYQVLYETRTSGTWVETGSLIEAHSAEEAVRTTVAAISDGGDDLPGTKWRAVPTRSWQQPPLTVEVEVETRLRVS